MSVAPTFSLTGPLPSGRVSIEASAGTGKTYTLAGLVVRYIAEARIPLEELLVVTFTRTAAAELRDRARARLVEAAAALSQPPGEVIHDELMRELANTGLVERTERLERLERAIVDFDAATITTIHGFARQVLSTLGSAAPGDLEARLVNDTTPLVDAVCADVLAAESVADPMAAGQLPTKAELGDLVTKILQNPGILVVPGPGPAESTAKVAQCRRLVDLAIDEVHRRRRAAGTISFDDVLTQLRDALGSSPAAKAILRNRFRVALIDEFQDTDPVQWEIFSRLFEDDDRGGALVMVADPKQAIFAFRGANVHTYLEAAYKPGTQRWTLGVNWRSDEALLDALGELLAGVTFGDERIGFVPISAAPQHRGVRLTGSGGADLPALRVRAVQGPSFRGSRTGGLTTDEAIREIASDLASQVQQLLEGGHLPSREGTEPTRRLRPGDVAVLVKAHKEAPFFQDALLARGIPAVVARGSNVAKSAAATQWRWLLNALARPADPTRARTAALSCFFGWPADRIDSADDNELSRVQDQLIEWTRVLGTDGVVELCAQVWSASGVVARVLATPTGDRDMTDLDHIAELLQHVTAGRRVTAAGLLTSLDQLAEDTGSNPDPEENVTARRVESEAEAVQILTAFAAKGLEYPVVCVPTLWRKSRTSLTVNVFQDPSTGIRTLDIAKKEQWPTSQAAAVRKALANEEAMGEHLRLLYVALTRAKHQTLVWWSRTKESNTTALARVLFARSGREIDHGLFTGKKVALPDDQQVVDAVRAVVENAGNSAEVASVDAGTGAATPAHGWVDDGVGQSTELLAVAVLGRELARTRRRWSFTTISSRAAADGFTEVVTPFLDPDDDSLGDTGAGDEPLEPMAGSAELAHSEGGGAKVGEPGETAGNGGGDHPPDTEPEPPLPLGPIPGGAQFGTLVHQVLERVDFSAPDLDAELQAQVADRMRWNPWQVSEADLVTGLRATIESPLGPLLPGLRLRDLTLDDRMSELNFEICLGGAARHPTDREIGTLVLGHLADDDPLRPWAQRLAAGLFDVELAGHLTGSIDAVFRVHTAAPASSPDIKTSSRFVIADYKTNRLNQFGHQPRSLDYQSGRLTVAMAQHHYPLQALLYSVALHRYLRWRVPDYQPAVQLGGAVYLFVRGMAGAGTPQPGGDPRGVFSWRIPPDLVTQLSDLLNGRMVNP